METPARNHMHPRGWLSASPVAIEQILPADLLLDIVARSDARALIRFAAVSKLLRRDILDLSFIRRITQEGGTVPPCIQAYLNIHTGNADPPPPLSLVHPTTHAAACFLDVHLSPYMLHFADDILTDYFPVTSRGGLVLLQRRDASNKLSNLCVYDLISGHRSFLAHPPCLDPNRSFDMCVLLTAADGIDGSFLLFVANLDDYYTSTMEVRTATSMCATWAPAVTNHYDSAFYFQECETMYKNVVVLQGGILHWLVSDRDEIVSYNVSTMEKRKFKVPAHIKNCNGEVYLGSYYSNDGRKLLRLLGLDRFKISVWHQLPDGCWESEAMVLETEEKLRSLDTENGPSLPTLLTFKKFGERSNTVLMNVYMWHNITILPVVLDLETKEMCVQRYSTPFSMVLEVDLPSRLRAMKIFP